MLSSVPQYSYRFTPTLLHTGNQKMFRRASFKPVFISVIEANAASDPSGTRDAERVQPRQTITAALFNMSSFPRTARWTTRNLVERTTYHRRRLLVVDDYRDAAEAITVLLSLAGYDTQFVLSGQAVSAVLTTWTPELALLDINMPDMDGFAVARQLRRAQLTRRMVIVAFTAQDEHTIRAEGVAAGFDGYCQKGGDPDALLRLLDQMTQMAR